METSTIGQSPLSKDKLKADLEEFVKDSKKTEIWSSIFSILRPHFSAIC